MTFGCKDIDIIRNVIEDSSSQEHVADNNLNRLSEQYIKDALIAEASSGTKNKSANNKEQRWGHNQVQRHCTTKEAREKRPKMWLKSINLFRQ